MFIPLINRFSNIISRWTIVARCSSTYKSVVSDIKHFNIDHIREKSSILYIAEDIELERLVVEWWKKLSMLGTEVIISRENRGVREKRASRLKVHVHVNNNNIDLAHFYVFLSISSLLDRACKMASFLLPLMLPLVFFYGYHIAVWRSFQSVRDIFALMILLIASRSTNYLELFTTSLPVALAGYLS